MFLYEKVSLNSELKISSQNCLKRRYNFCTITSLDISKKEFFHLSYSTLAFQSTILFFEVFSYKNILTLRHIFLESLASSVTQLLQCSCPLRAAPENNSSLRITQVHISSDLKNSESNLRCDLPAAGAATKLSCDQKFNSPQDERFYRFRRLSNKYEILSLII